MEPFGDEDTAEQWAAEPWESAGTSGEGTAVGVPLGRQTSPETVLQRSSLASLHEAGFRHPSGRRTPAQTAPLAAPAPRT